MMMMMMSVTKTPLVRPLQLLILLATCFICTITASASYEYEQLSSWRYALHANASGLWGLQLPSSSTVRSVSAIPSSSSKACWLLADSGIYRVDAYNGDGAPEVNLWSGYDLDDTTIMAATTSQVLLINSQNILQQCLPLSHVTFTCKPISLPIAKPVTVLQCSNDVCVFASQDEVWSFGGGVVQPVIRQLPNPVTAITVTTATTASTAAPVVVVLVATTEKILRFDNGAEQRMIWRQSITERNITAITVNPADGAIFYASPDSIYRQDATTYTLQRLDSRPGGGLPYNQTTQLSASATSGVWAASPLGAMRYEPNITRPSSYFRRWRYFYGPRWLANGDTTPAANSIVSIDAGDGCAWILTRDGVAVVIVNATATLQDKARHYQSLVEPRHDRFGLVSDVGLLIFGNLSSYVKQSSDNDGLWTSIYLASQCFRYAVTGDETARASAWHAFEALELLNNVTGIHGLMARSILPIDAPQPGGTWHNSTVYPSLQWKGDTSSDEVTGHLFVYPLFHDLVCQNDEERARPAHLITTITAYIVRNNYTLVDITGRRTTWGVWQPAYLNANESWYDERGVNSLQILSWLKSAQRISSSPIFTNAIKDLIVNHGYHVNLVNAKITVPDDDNFSDDELTFLPYFTWGWANLHGASAFPDNAEQLYQVSAERTWAIVASEKPSLWNVMYGGGVLTHAQCMNVNDTLADLTRWPLSFINYPVMNSQRLDFAHDPYRDRGNHAASLVPIPTDERQANRWNADLFDMDGGNGRSECDPSAWLISYWMASGWLGGGGGGGDRRRRVECARYYARGDGGDDDDQQH